MAEAVVVPSWARNACLLTDAKSRMVLNRSTGQSAPCSARTWIELITALDQSSTSKPRSRCSTVRSLVPRTDFTDDAAWAEIQTVMGADGVTYVSDTRHLGITMRALVMPTPRRPTTTN